MANENRCPKCGSEMVPNPSFADISDCKKCDLGFVVNPTNPRIAELERQLEEAKACAEDMKQRNAKLRQERVDYYNGSALEKVMAKYNGLLVSYDTLAQKPGRELILEKEVKNYAARLHDESRKVYEARLERDEAQGRALELQSERDTALAESRKRGEEVLALREALQGLCDRSWHSSSCDQAYGDPLCDCGHEKAWDIADEALSNTSATAQQFVERIEREALKKALAKLTKGDFRVQQFTYKMGCDWVSLAAETALAAILSEKEKG